MIMKQLDSVRLSELSEDETTKAPKPQPQAARVKTSTGTRPTRNISTLRSREAAAALAGNKLNVGPARTAAAPKPRLASALMPKKKTRIPTNPSSMRNTAAAAATSKTTVGYTKGRCVSATVREHQVKQKKSESPQPSLSPETYMRLYGPPPLGSEMWFRCKAAGCLDDTEENVEPEELLAEDEEAENFQLTL